MGRNNNVDIIRIAAEKQIIEIGSDFNGCSASGSLLDRGAGGVITRENLA